MKEFILIYWYHDCYVAFYNSIIELVDYLNHLKQVYKNDKDFYYKVYCGWELSL